jgi:hypothetical protein
VKNEPKEELKKDSFKLVPGFSPGIGNLNVHIQKSCKKAEGEYATFDVDGMDHVYKMYVKHQ